MIPLFISNALIEYKLEYSAKNVERSSLWEVASSVKAWLKMAHPDHPTVKRYIEADEKLRQNRSSKITYQADATAYSSAEIYLLTGFLMGIRALKESIEPAKYLSVFRLTAREPKRFSEEEWRESRLYWALRN